MVSKSERQRAGKALVALGAALTLLGPAFSFSFLPGQAFANGQLALVLNGNQCSQASGPTVCGTGCYVYQCLSLPSASPGVILATTDGAGNAQFTVQSYTTGSGYGYAGCGYGPWYIAPFYVLEANINGQWQLESQVYIGINGPWCANPSSPSFPLQYQNTPITDYIKNVTGFANISICNVSCSSPPTVTVTQTTIGTTTLTTTIRLTQIISGTATITTTTTTITQPVVQQTTQTVNGPTTTQTVVSTQYSTVTSSATTTIVPTPVTVTQTVQNTVTQAGPTVTATSTTTGTSVSTFTVTLTHQGSSGTVTRTLTLTASTASAGVLPSAGPLGGGMATLGVLALAAGVILLVRKK